MIIAKIHYGLGNQLFQYSLARRLAIQKNTDFSLCVGFFKEFKNEEHPRIYQLNHFNIIENILPEKKSNHYLRPGFLERRIRNIENLFLPYYKRKIVYEQQLDFDENILKVKSNVFLSGYWQDERYFEPVKNILKKELSFKTKPGSQNEQYLQMIRNSNAVSLHIRKGDYLTDPYTIEKVGGCDMAYYLRAVQNIISKIPDAVFYIFSDDPVWVKENFHIGHPYIHISHNSQASAYEDLRLMSQCSHHIIANSSFSWWGAWLGFNENKMVIAPKVWRKKGPGMFLPKGWTSI